MAFIADFVRALQFLTRFQLVEEVDWSLEALGRSVRFFPWAGGVIGLVLGGCAWGMVQLFGEVLPVHAAAALLILLEILLTGGLHCDGFRLIWFKPLTTASVHHLASARLLWSLGLLHYPMYLQGRNASSNIVKNKTIIIIWKIITIT